jgi:archaellum component FlaC
MSDLELTMMRRVGELNKEVDALKAENARLKTEVKHLMVFCNCTLIPNKELQAEVERLDTLCKQLMAQHSDISCENIMLRKAGDAMASSIQFNEEMAKDYNGPTIVHQSVQRWYAAKEGKGQL